MVFRGLLFCVNMAVYVVGYNMREHLNAATPYYPQQDPADYTPPPPSCEPIQVNHVVRHGTRTPARSDMDAFGFLASLLAAHVEAVQDPVARAWMEEWKSPFDSVLDAGTLIELGEVEMFDMAARFQQHLPSLFPSADGITVKYHPSWMRVQTTSLPRVTRSGAAYTFGILDGLGSLGDCGYQPSASFSDSNALDNVLYFFANCPAYSSAVASHESAQYQHLWEQRHVPSIIERVSQRLQLDGTWTITVEELLVMLTGCKHELAVFNTSDMWCSLFREEDIAVAEYAYDVGAYYRMGAGLLPLNAEVPTVQLRSLLDHMEAAIAGHDILTARANLLFGHEASVLMLLTALDLFREDVPLTPDSPPGVIDGRTFRTSVISPYGANTALILYRCNASNDPDYVVRVLHNEKEEVIPVCSDYGVFCPWDTFRGALEPAASVNFSRLCDLSSNEPALAPLGGMGPVPVTILATSTFLAGVVGVLGVMWATGRLGARSRRVDRADESIPLKAGK